MGLTTLKCQIFRVRSILWAFVIPELKLLFTTQGWSPQQYSIYFASNRVLFDAKKSSGLFKKHYSWITFFLVEKRDPEQSFRGAWEDQPRQRLSLEEMDPRNLFKSRNIFMQQEKKVTEEYFMRNILLRKDNRYSPVQRIRSREPCHGTFIG